MTSESENTKRRGAPRSTPISGVVDLRPKRAPIDWDEAKRLYVDESYRLSDGPPDRLLAERLRTDHVP